MPGPLSGVAIRFTHDPTDAPADSVTYVLDTTWTPTPASVTNGEAAQGEAPSDSLARAGSVVGVRGVAERVLAARDLIADTSARLDRWAAGSGVVELLTIRDTSFWFYVRLRHWLWLEERILWAGIVDAIVREQRPASIRCAAGTDPALVDVLRLVASRDRITLDLEAPAPEPEPALDADVTAGAGEDSRDAAAPGRAPTDLRHSALATLARRVRDRFREPPPPAWIARRRIVAERARQIQVVVDAIAAEPARRLLVVHEHAQQRVDTAEGTRWMNPYLDPIVDRLRGTPLDPIVLDIRAWVGHDDAWERIGAGRNPRLLPADALSAQPPTVPDPAAIETPAADAQETDGTLDDDEPVIDPVLAAWRDAVACPVEAFGVDLGPALAAEVAAVASRWQPSMTGSIDRIQRFIERIRPAGIILADEYHRQDWMAAAHAAAVPVAAVQHGMIYPHHNGYIHATRPAALRLPQRTFVFGRWERDLLRTASVYREEEVVVGGSPRLDLVVRDAGARNAVRRELGIADDERIVLISGTWGGLYRRFHYPIALAALADRPLPGVHVVVKLHPGEPDEGPYRRIIESAAAAGGFAAPPITIVRSIDLYRLLAASDAHLGIHSTLLTEAVVTRTPNLLADGLAGADLLGYIPAGVALPVHDGGDLLAALDAAAAGALGEQAAATFTAAHFEPGRASERIAADLRAWLA